MAPTSGTPNQPGDRSDYVVVPPRTLGQLRLLTVGPVELDLDGKQLRIAGETIHVRLKEFDSCWPPSWTTPDA